MAKPLKENIARLLTRLSCTEVGGTDWIECDETNIDYLRTLGQHARLREAGMLFSSQLYVAVTTPAFAPQSYLLKFTRRH